MRDQSGCVVLNVLLSDDVQWCPTQLLSTVAGNSTTWWGGHEGTLTTSRHWENVSALHLHCHRSVVGCCDSRSWPDCRLQVWGNIDCFTLLFCCVFASVLFHRRSGDCLEGKRENYHVCSVQYYVQQLYTMNCTHIWTDLTVLWIGFCLTGPISLCLDSFVCMYFLHLTVYCMCAYCVVL